MCLLPRYRKTGNSIKVFLIESCLALNLSPILSLARLFYTFSMTVTISFPHHYSFFYIQNDSVEKWVTNGCKNVTTFISSSLTYAHLKALKTNSTCNKAWNIFKFNVGLRAKDSSPHKYEFASDVYLCRRFDWRSRIGLQFCLLELPGTHLLLNVFVHTAPKTFQSGGRMLSLMETVGGFKLHIVSKDGRRREPVINQRNKRQGT